MNAADIPLNLKRLIRKMSYANRLAGVWSLVTYTDEHEDREILNHSVPILKGF